MPNCVQQILTKITWTVFEKEIIVGMPNSDNLVFTQSYLIMMRQEHISLVEWSTNPIMIRSLAAQKGGTKISNVLVFKLLTCVSIVLSHLCLWCQQCLRQKDSQFLYVLLHLLLYMPPGGLLLHHATHIVHDGMIRQYS